MQQNLFLSYTPTTFVEEIFCNLFEFIRNVSVLKNSCFSLFSLPAIDVSSKPNSSNSSKTCSKPLKTKRWGTWLKLSMLCESFFQCDSKKRQQNFFIRSVSRLSTEAWSTHWLFLYNFGLRSRAAGLSESATFRWSFWGKNYSSIIDQLRITPQSQFSGPPDQSISVAPEQVRQVRPLPDQ